MDYLKSKITRVLFDKILWENYLAVFIEENSNEIHLSNRIGAYYTIIITLFYIVFIDVLILNHVNAGIILLKCFALLISMLFLYLNYFPYLFFEKSIIKFNILYQIAILAIILGVIANDMEHYSYYFHASTILLVGLNIILWIPPRYALLINFSYMGLLVFYLLHFTPQADISSKIIHDTVITLIYSSIGIASNILNNFWRFINYRDKKKFFFTMEKLKIKSYEIHHLSQTDELSGLFNRRFLIQNFEFVTERAMRHGFTTGLMILDLDFLKTINDKFGHVLGDKAVKEFSSIIRKRIRKNDIAARIGGDEFCILFENISKDQLLKIAEEIRKRTQDNSISSKNATEPFHITTSIGCTVFQSVKNLTFDKIYHSIDKALYQSKQKGRNQVTYIDYLPEE